MHPASRNDILDAGQWLYLQSVKFWVGLSPANCLNAQIYLDLGLLLSMTLLGMLVYRATPHGKALFASHKKWFVALNGPFVAPGAVVVTTVTVFFALPSWATNQGLHWVPSLQTLAFVAWGGLGLAMTYAAVFADPVKLWQYKLSPKFFYGPMALGAVVAAYFTEFKNPEKQLIHGAALACAIATLIAIKASIKRCFRDRGLKSKRGEARWASREEIVRHPTARFQLPIYVSYTGSTEEWNRWNVGAGRTCLGLPSDTVVRHIFLEGISGSAKGYGVFAPIIASCTTAFIYQDFKGEAPGYELQKKRTGKNPILWGAAGVDTYQSMGWNPLEECRRSATPEDEFGFLASVLVPSQSEKGDWVADLTRPILHYLFVQTNYPSLGALHDAVIERGVGAVLAEANVPQGLVEALSGKNVKEYIGTTLFSVLSHFGTGWGRRVSQQHDFAIDEVLDRGGYVLSVENDPNRRLPLNIFWRFIIRRIMGSTKKRPCVLLLDEALAVGRIDKVTDVLEAARSKDVGCIFGVQSMAGVRRVYGESAESLLEGFAGRITLLNGLSPGSRKVLQERLGKRVVKEKGHGNKAERILVDLMSPDDLDRRANQFQRWWTIIETVGSTRAGNRILGILQGMPGLTTPPPEMLEDESRNPIKLDEQDGYVTPPLAVQDATRAAHAQEIGEALNAASVLEALAKKGAVRVNPIEQQPDEEREAPPFDDDLDRDF